MIKLKPGISVIVCCYNSAKRIELTLEHLVNQEFQSKLDWEIILIDNNSTDDTAKVASKHMSLYGSKVSFRVVQESTPGLSHARNKGFAESVYEIVLMVDDDNSLAPNYVEGVFAGFEDDQKIGMVGGLGIAQLEESPPDWFEKYANCFAVGNQHVDESREIEHLYGAGLALRLNALNKIKASGFSSILTDRTGSNLMSGGDTELCYVFRMAGYQLKYLQQLTFKHHLPKGRVNWNYVRRLYSGFGKTKAFMETYTAVASGQALPVEGKLPFWRDRITYLLGNLLSDFPILTAGLFSKLEGNDRILTATAKLGHIQKIYQLKSKYLDNYRKVFALQSNLKQLTIDDE